MREWQRAGAWRLCGYCRARLRPDDPVLVITIGRIRKLRCAVCAGGAPPELPPLVVKQEPLRAFVPVRLVADSLPLDWKQRQAREPGSDD